MSETRKECAALAASIAALEALLDDDPPPSDPEPIQDQITKLELKRVELGCDVDIDWDGLNIPPPGPDLISKVATQQAAAKVAIDRDFTGEAVIAIADAVLDAAGSWS